MEKNINGYKTMVIEPESLEEMILNEGSVCIVNPKDEEPHIDQLTQRLVQFQHGDTKVTGDDISVGFVFRVSPHSYLCNIEDNRVLLPDNIIKLIQEKKIHSKVNKEERNKLYSKFDKVKYHNILKSHFKHNYN